MHSNELPHLNLYDESDRDLVAGGGLKDGWSYLMPSDDTLLYEEVSTAFADELEDHVKEQTEALKNLYLSTSTRGSLLKRRNSVSSECLDSETSLQLNEGETKSCINFVVKRGLQVIACAALNERLLLSDIVIVPSAKSSACKALLDAVKLRVQKSNSDMFYIELCNIDDMPYFEENGCKIVADESSNSSYMIRMSCST